MELDTRDIALTILTDIDVNKTFSSDALEAGLRKIQFDDKRDRAFITRLVEGTVEYRLQIDEIIKHLTTTKLNKMKPAIRNILRMGIYQIRYMDSVPERAAVNEAVRLAKAHKLAGLSGFVNAILRNVSRKKEEIDELIQSKISIKYSIPGWIVNLLQNSYGEETAEKILASLYEDRPTTIRVNRVVTDKETLKKKLLDAGISVEESEEAEDALLISGYDFIRRVPGYKTGDFSVEDISSMLSVVATGVKEGDKVLDVCAAPGGKTAYFAEKGAKVRSRDISEDKLELIRENVERLKIDDRVICERKDALLRDVNSIGVYDIVLCDVPCSGLGVMGRKNDIKYRVSPQDLVALSKMGLKMLNVSSEYVKHGGILSYSTCTINPEENERNVERFLKDNKEYEKIKERLFLQGRDDTDGFYYCIMRRK
ncbi:MAG: 16S rRNA (cytosine(967)-C(5))-methyltransferase RsmB [Eubacterium sp.]|nr:16S rRNA (cytosine(967)-C(5))-methyltransferase RsmB [Eubacterium sp.]